MLICAALILSGVTASNFAPEDAVAATIVDRTGACAGSALQIVAHEDDDLLFQSPDVLHDIQAGRCLRTVFVTAGDAAHGEAYWNGRELGSESAYARMAAVTDAWTTTEVNLAGHAIRERVLTAAPNISLLFMRLPDGNRRGTGMISHHHQSLMRLWNGAIGTIDALDGSQTYTASSLSATLTAILTEFKPTTVRTQDWTAEFGAGDNADHIATALFVQQADKRYHLAHTLAAYGGYPTWTRLPNVNGPDRAAKRSAFNAYAEHDPELCLHAWCADGIVATLRLARQYVTASSSTSDSARGAGVKVTASSQNNWSGQTARKAIDGSDGGYPDASTSEWATRGGGSGSWIQLDFPKPTLINGVMLSDRPNLDDQITGGTLVFSDGSRVPTGTLANNGSVCSLSFTPRTVTSIRLTITSVSASTTNAGLAELSTYDNMPPLPASPIVLANANG